MPITEATYRTHSPIPPFLTGDNAVLNRHNAHAVAGTEVVVIDIHDLTPDGWEYWVKDANDNRFLVHVTALNPLDPKD